MTDLFGRPIYGEGPKPRQFGLFPDEHWFHLGYMDCWHGAFDAAPCDQERSAYAWHAGYQAAQRDRQQDDRDSNCDPARAFRQAKAVGNVEG